MNIYKMFDHLGIIAFLIILIDAIIYLSQGVSNWRVYLRLLIGLGGFSVDIFLVFFYKGNKK